MTNREKELTEALAMAAIPLEVLFNEIINDTAQYISPILRDSILQATIEIRYILLKGEEPTYTKSQIERALLQAENHAEENGKKQAWDGWFRAALGNPTED